MSRKKRTIALPVRCILWGRSAGRCEFCSRPVSFHPETKETVNLADAAHIIGFSEKGPRGEAELSKELASDISNLMLLCGDCHKLVDDKRTKPNYPVDFLRQRKEAHERRIGIVTGIRQNRQSHILLYDANIGKQNAKVTYGNATSAMLSERWWPADTIPLAFGMKNSFHDHTKDFWEIESAHLDNAFFEHLRPGLASGAIEHLSIFAYAPQPLLMLLGYLLSDIHPAEVYQLHREPPDWQWQSHPEGFEYIVEKPDHMEGKAALVLALSATVQNDRVAAVLGDKVAIWRLTIPRPDKDFLRSRQQLRQFRVKIRTLLDQIKARHGENTVLHVFPAAPVSTAVEFGRAISPKAVMPMKIYDQNEKLGGFVYALDLGPVQGAAQ